MIHHVTIAVRGRSALGRDERERRLLVRALTACAGECLLLLALVDEHLHAALRTARPGYLARDLRRVLVRARQDLQLKPAHLEPVDNRAYLSWLVRYLLTQPQKHGVSGPAALWTGCFLQDLAGARLLPGFDRRLLLEELPRFRLGEHFAACGLAPVPLDPADDEALRRAGAARVVDLAAGVFAAGPDLSQPGRSAELLAARVLAAQAGLTVGLPPLELARYLGVQPRAVRRLAATRGHPWGLEALRRRLTLEERARDRVARPA